MKKECKDNWIRKNVLKLVAFREVKIIDYIYIHIKLYF